MPHAFLEDFEERKRHVRHYLAVVSRTDRLAGLRATRTEEGRLLTLRAGTFLVLYNLVEATTRGAIEAIHDQITTGNIPFSRLSLSLRKEVIRLFKKTVNPNIHHTMDNFPSGFVSIALAQGIKLSGTVDAKMIRELGLLYGFSCYTNRIVTRDGADLLTIKRNRNDLAHGLKTFEEVGRDYTWIDLLLLSRRTMRYIDGILNNIVSYLDQQNYLESVSPTGPNPPPDLTMAT
jgi:hypothetical protein